MTRPLVLKFGGELLEEPAHLRTAAAAIARITRTSGRPLVVVHGGGRDIDQALARAGIGKQQVDGLRVTDDATLGVVVAVLAGTVNTRFVATLTAAGVRAVGLTGADAGCARCAPAPAHRAVDGRLVDLGRVGIPDAGSDAALLTTLVDNGFVPVVASLGADADGQLYNVNADTMAGHLAARLNAWRLVMAGTTSGVLDGDGSTRRTLDPAAIDRLVRNGTATAGMIAKLRAAEQALRAGVDEVVILDGREQAAIESAAEGSVPAAATRILASEPVAARETA